MKYTLKVLAGLALAGGSTLAVAATPAIVAAIHARQANFKEIGGDFKAVNDEIKTGSPSWTAVRSSAHDLATRAAGQARYFVRGSGPESGEKTRALPAIWSDTAGFAQANAEFVRAAAALDGAAQRGDMAGLLAARGALGGACKGCHDKFRAPQD